MCLSAGVTLLNAPLSVIVASILYRLWNLYLQWPIAVAPCMQCRRCSPEYEGSQRFSLYMLIASYIAIC